MIFIEDGEARFRAPKPVYEERELVEKLFPWAVTIFDKWQISRSLIAPAFDKEGYSKTTIYTRSHSFLPALKK